VKQRDPSSSLKIRRGWKMDGPNELVYVHYMNLLHGNISTGILFGVNRECNLEIEAGETE
jgi:hypothetical protein